jgi:HAD superfamily hydrolase (TIGR01450 family)
VSIDFSQYPAVLLDLDGTIYHEEHPLPGAVDLLHRLRDEGRRFACLSNSTNSPLQVMARLARMGVELDPGQIYTAAAAAADHVVDKFRPRARVFNLSTEGIHEMLDGLVDWVQTGGERCDAVIVGTPVSVYATFERQRIALQLLRNGASLVGICADRVYPSPRGIEFGSGALTWMMAYAGTAAPTFCGKPEEVFFRRLCARLGVAPAGCLLIGDNFESDIFGAKNLDMHTVLTLTGVTRRRDLLKVDPEYRPEMVIEDLTEL